MKKKGRVTLFNFGEENTPEVMQTMIARALRMTPAERFRQLDELNKTAAAFQISKARPPKGLFKFKTFEEADKWWFKVITGRTPSRLQ